MFQGGRQEALPYAPVSLATLESGVTELLAENGEMPDISVHFESWKAQSETEGAGVFTIPVAKIVDLVEQVATRQGA